MTLRLPGLSGCAALALDDLAEGGELGVARRIHLPRRREQRRETVAVLDQVLPPADEVHVLQQHLDLAADEQALEGRVVDVHVLDVDLLDGLGVGLDLRQGGLDVGELPLDRQGERRDGALHPLEDVDPQQVDEAFFAVHLAEEALAAADLGAVLRVVGRLLVRQHVTQRRVGAEVEAADFVVDLADRAELAGAVHVGLDVDGLEPLGESAGLVGAVVLLDVLAGAGDGQQVEQLEVVEAEHVHEAGRLPLGVLQGEPAVELHLRLADGCLDAGMPWSASAVSSPSVTKAIWFLRSARRLLTGVAESIRTRVLTPSLMIRRIRRS